jgi:hypothetical protein
MEKFFKLGRGLFLKLVFSVLILLFGARTANATNYVWSGLGGLFNSNWNNPLNWLPTTVPSTGDNVTFLNVVFGFNVNLTADVNVGSITTLGVIGLLNPVTITTQGHALTVSNALTVGQFQVASLLSLPSVITPSALTILGNGLVTLNGTVTVYTGGKLNFGSSADNTTNVKISGATVGLADFIDSSLLSIVSNLLATLGLTSATGPSMNNYGRLTSSTSAFNLSGFYSSINNSGTFNANSSIFNLTGSNGAITNTNVFNLGTSSIIYPTGASTLVSNASPGIFTLKSDNTGSAAIGAVGFTSSGLSGIFNVERYITGGGFATNRGYRMLSSPVVNAAGGTNTYGLFYLRDHYYDNKFYPGAYISGLSGSWFNAISPNATIYFYDEAPVYNNNTFLAGNNVGVSSIIPATMFSGSLNVTTSQETFNNGKVVTMPVGNGFIVYFVGPSSRTSTSASIAPQDATLTANGTLNQGDVPVTFWNTGTTQMSYTPLDSSHPYPGLSMVGNPYACTIDLTALLSDNTGINKVYKLSERDSPNQLYVAYTGNGNSSPIPPYALSGEGFLVQATGAGKTLKFKESEKVPTKQLTSSALVLALKRNNVAPGSTALSAIEPQNILTGLYLKMEKDSSTYNYCGIYFRNDWSDKYGEDDAKDFNASLPVNMASFATDGTRLAVNHMSDYSKGIKVRLYASSQADGQYKISAEGIRNIDTALYDIYLLDHYKKDSLDIRRYGTYVFDVIKSDTLSYGGYRFELSIQPRPLAAYSLNSFVGEKMSAGVQLTWKTSNEGNYTGFELQKQDGTTYNVLYTKQSDGSGTYTYVDPSPVTGNNIYRLLQAGITGNISYSLLISIVYNAAGAGGLMSVYPNPAKAIINVNLSTQSTTVSAYKASIYNAAGQLILQKSIWGNSWAADITNYTPGTYIVQMRDSNGTVMGKSKFVKTN